MIKETKCERCSRKAIIRVQSLTADYFHDFCEIHNIIYCIDILNDYESIIVDALGVWRDIKK